MVWSGADLLGSGGQSGTWTQSGCQVDMPFTVLPGTYWFSIRLTQNGTVLPTGLATAGAN
jgi:hypothetical protein